ncbi:serine hydrolase domain-containing protein [Nonomuraea fuscirosea]|uniref:serine hydrolase domain-containing protein n=1 Tax=Nonomuraea fuscirosea TaxID=1291556 RepID=UPI00341DD065
MRWLRVGGVLLAAMTALTACGNGDVPCPPDPGPIGVFVADTMPKEGSGTVMAARGGRIAYCEGFGLADRAAGVRASCDTVYDVMSITKQFTAAAILKLEMMGKLRVTDPISRHLGQVPAGKRPITLHQLLTHTAGLAEGLGDDYDVLSRDDFLTRALASKPLSAPGTTFHYSNMGYGLLAAIVEKVSGLGYENFLAEHLFAPAGMTRTGYVLPTWEPGRIAVEYDDQGAAHGRPIAHPWAQDGPYWNLRGNGGMLSTARDLLRWHRALSGTGVLSAAAKRKMFSPQVRMPDSHDSYGYGWVISDTDAGRIAWHDGGNSWSLANLARSLDDDVMVFWASNHAYQRGRWNLEDLMEPLTWGVACRARIAAAPTSGGAGR